MDIRKIKKLIELIDETGIAEIEIKEGEESLRLSRTSTVLPVAAPVVSQAAPSSAPVATAPKEVSQSQTGHAVKSPMVGTLYASANPGSEPFVNVGQKVSVGDTLCIIEAMKMFNEIEADKAGVISEIVVNNGEPVEYGQTLFIIE